MTEYERLRRSYNSLAEKYVELETKLAAAEAEAARLREALFGLIHDISAWGQRTAGQTLPGELSEAIANVEDILAELRNRNAKR